MASSKRLRSRKRFARSRCLLMSTAMRAVVSQGCRAGNAPADQPREASTLYTAGEAADKRSGRRLFEKHGGGLYLQPAKKGGRGAGGERREGRPEWVWATVGIMPGVAVWPLAASCGTLRCSPVRSASRQPRGRSHRNNPEQPWILALSGISAS